MLDNEIDRLDRVVKRFLDFTRPVEMHMEDISLAEVLSSVIELARPQIERANVTVKMKLATDLPATRGDQELLRQAVLNLVLNAVEAMKDGGQLSHPTGEGRGQRRDPRGRYGQRNSAGAAGARIPALFHDAQGRKRSRPGDGVPDCATA